MINWHTLPRVVSRALFVVFKSISQGWRWNPISVKDHFSKDRFWKIENLTIKLSGEGTNQIPVDVVPIALQPRFVGEETHIHAVRYKPLAPQPSLVEEGVVHPFLVWAKSSGVFFWEKLSNALLVIGSKPRDGNGSSGHIKRSEINVSTNSVISVMRYRFGSIFFQSFR
jgi:hypothetical protein